MLRYYFDEHLKAPIAEQLLVRGIDVLTAQQARHADQAISDSDQLAFAASVGRVMVTEDRDFIVLAHAQVPHAGIVMMQRRLSIGEAVEYLELLAKVTEPDEVRDRLVYCDWE
jgi:predicted nuclease of predicted toxin-antitoxin system